MTIYRKIWESNFGPIPLDSDGKSYEIHHIDGNRANNDLDNLMCVSIQEHYNIHFKQGDYNACLLILERMNLTADEISKKARDIALRQIEQGTHNFSKPGFQKKNAQRRVKEGTHHWLGERNPSHERVKNGTHNFQNSPNKKCEHCGKEVDIGNYNLHHGKYCYKYTGVKSPGAISMQENAGKHTANTIWITNGIDNKRIASNEKMPIGFYNGRTNKRNIK